MGTEAKHTPGPWHVDEPPYEFNRYISGNAHKDGDDWVSTSVAKVLGNATSRNVTEANARLIAAAPELLDAVKELADLMDAVRDGNYAPDSFTTQPARAAIAKATGAEAVKV